MSLALVAVVQALAKLGGGVQAGEGFAGVLGRSVGVVEMGLGRGLVEVEVGNEMAETGIEEWLSMAEAAGVEEGQKVIHLCWGRSRPAGQ